MSQEQDLIRETEILLNSALVNLGLLSDLIGEGPVVPPVDGSNLVVDANFAGGVLLVNGQSASFASQFAVSNPTGGYAADSSGREIWFPPGVARVTDKGLRRDPYTRNRITDVTFASWSVESGSTKILNDGIGPTGSKTAMLLRDKTTGNAHKMSWTVSMPHAETVGWWTYSMKIARASGIRDALLEVCDGGWDRNASAFFMLGRGGAGTSSNPRVKAYSILEGDFYRCVMTFPMDAEASGHNDIKVMVGTAMGYSQASYTSPDATSGIWCDMPQLQSGKHVTNFVKGEREADKILITGETADAIADEKGTIFITLGDGTQFSTDAHIISDNGVPLIGYTATDKVVAGTLAAMGTPNRFLFKDQIALAWDAGSKVLVLNGNDSVVGTMSAPTSQLTLGSKADGSVGICGYIQQMKVHNEMLVDLGTKLNLVSGKEMFGFMVLGPDVGQRLGYPANYLTTADWDYFKAKDLKSIRHTILWENLQPTLMGSLDQAHVGSLMSALDKAASRGIGVILSPMFSAQQGKEPAYKKVTGGPVYVIGTPELTVPNFADFWSRMATAFRDTPGLGGYHIGNEPVGISTATWTQSAQAAIDAIRAVDQDTPIYLQGDCASDFGIGWAGGSWNPISVTDPSNKIVWDAHSYFDNGQGGSFHGQFSSYNRNAYQGVLDILPFLNWTKKTKQVGWMGEWGIPGYARGDACSISGSVLTVGSSGVQGRWDIGLVLVGNGVPPGTTIISNGTGTGGAGTYNLDRSATVANTRITGYTGPAFPWLPTLDVVNAALAQSGVKGAYWYYGAAGSNQGGHGWINPVSGNDDLRVTHLLRGH
jgi:endoglucanase